MTLIEVGDYQCRYTRRAYPVIERLQEEYPTDLRVVFKHNPLAIHEFSFRDAVAAVAAGRQGAFWKMHRLLLEMPRGSAEARLVAAAASLDLDLVEFRRDLADPAIAEEILEDQAEADALGIRGTPGFVINGRFLSGAHPIEAFRAVIDEELARAKELVTSGVPKQEIYETASKNRPVKCG